MSELWKVCFSRTSVSGDVHDSEILFETKEDAVKAMDLLQNKDSSLYDLEILPANL